MSIALNQKMPSAPGRPVRRTLPWALMWLCLAILVAHVAYDVLGPMRLHASQEPGRRTAPEAIAVPQAKEQAATPSAATSVTLPESKFQQARIATEPARIDRLPTEVGVVGMIQPNADQQVEVHPRATGIIREVRAVLGQKVKQGEILVILDSPEVGKARLDLRAASASWPRPDSRPGGRARSPLTSRRSSPSCRRTSPRTSRTATSRTARSDTM